MRKPDLEKLVNRSPEEFQHCIEQVKASNFSQDDKDFLIKAIESTQQRIKLAKELGVIE